MLAVAASAEAQQTSRPNDTPRSVTLSLAEYNRMLDLANRPAVTTTPPPVAAVLSTADMRVRVDGQTVRGMFGLTGEVLRPGVARVPLLAHATLVDATTAGRPLPLAVDGTNHAALLPGPAPFDVRLEWGTALTLRPGRALFMLPVPPAGSARVTIDVPGDQADVRLSPGLVTRRRSADGRTLVEATLDPGSNTQVSWSMRDSAPVAAARESRVVADVFTLLTIGDADLRMVALVDLTVSQGEPRTFDVRLPQGYELLGISGASIESSDPRDGSVLLTVAEPAARRHQFLAVLERPYVEGSAALETGFLTVNDVQRERGEIAVEGVGTIELAATEREGMHRIDVRELNRSLQSLSRQPILSAFRYQRSATAPPALTLETTRFADAGVLAAVADSAAATTLVTAEGRALTELRLTLQNRAQPFLKVAFPAGASIVSVEVEGQTAKPVQGTDGTRIPLLRPGFRPKGAYTVSFVYLHEGTPFLRKGDMQMMLPRMDIPVGLVTWEVFVPERYAVKRTGGNVIDWAMPATTAPGRGDTGIGRGAGLGSGSAGGTGGGSYREGSVAGGVVGGLEVPPEAADARGQIRGLATDIGGVPLAGVAIDVDAGSTHQTVTTAADGSFAIAGLPSGPVTLTAQLAGFRPVKTELTFNQEPRRIRFVMSLAGREETLTVAGQLPASDNVAEPSQNVVNLQQRTAGILPVRIDVPRAGTSHQFFKPLVVDQETLVNFSYRRR
jgi:hypothetical protein